MIQQIATVQQSALSFRKKTKQLTGGDFSQILADKLEIKESIYDELKKEYNIRSATFDEVIEIAQMLYENGEITLKEVAILTFDYERATQNIKKAAKGNVAHNFTMFETSADLSGRRDWIAEFEARAAKDKRYGNLIGYKNKTRIISILKLLEE